MFQHTVLLKHGSNIFGKSGYFGEILGILQGIKKPKNH